MANNRMYLHCKGCGGLFFLGKRFGTYYCWCNYAKINNITHANDPNWTAQDDRLLEDKLNQFYYDHELCGDTGPDHFDIVYEMNNEEVL